MPTITYHRNWCTACNDFTLHYADKCKTCKTDTNYAILIKDIPREKIMEQRQRYKQSKRKGLGILGGAYFKQDNPFSTEFPKPEIIESDAGQEAIDEKRYAMYEEERKKRIQLQEEANKTYLKLGRNDICPTCSAEGLNIKFKKCKHFELYKNYL